MFKKVTIIGVGLMGASLGLAVKKRKLAAQVCGYFRHKKKIPRALRLGIVDQATDDLQEAVADSDLIVISTPVSDVVQKLSWLRSYRPRPRMVMDMGSTKTEIVRAGRGLNFIGCHPLAGSEKSGMEAARADLFVSAACLITPETKTPRAILKKALLFWKKLGSRSIIMSPRRHDRLLAYSSHLPHAAAYAMMCCLPQESLFLSGSGLKDSTRIALSHPGLWADIFLSNRRYVLSSLKAFEKALGNFRRVLSSADARSLMRLLEEARHKRGKI